MTLVEGYLRQRAARGIQEGVSRELASHLESLWRAGQTAHPDLPVSVQGFTGHLAAVVEDPAHLERLEAPGGRRPLPGRGLPRGRAGRGGAGGGELWR